MSDKKYTLPQKMVDAAYQWCPASFAMPAVIAMLEAAVKWLAENPVIPNDKQLREMCFDGSVNNNGTPADAWQITNYIREWQRRMFLAPEPDSLESLLSNVPELVEAEKYKRNIIEAYELGKKFR